MYLKISCLAFSTDAFDDCRFGKVRSKAIQNQDVVVFGDEFGGVKNPVNFTFSKWTVR